jgi:hypothetical protein
MRFLCDFMIEEFVFLMFIIFHIKTGSDRGLKNAVSYARSMFVAAEQKFAVFVFYISEPLSKENLKGSNEGV